jgi:hypothetical protein
VGSLGVIRDPCTLAIFSHCGGEISQQIETLQGNSGLIDKEQGSRSLSKRGKDVGISQGVKHLPKQTYP